MPIIPVDLSGVWDAIRTAFGFPNQDDELAEMALQLAEEARNEIARLALTNLLTSADTYIAGLQIVQHKPSGGVCHAEVILNGDLANMIEQGWAGGDMKPWLISGRNSKVAKDGHRYNIVPFRHMGTGSTGRNGQPFGSQFVTMLGDRDAGALGRRVERLAKKLKAGERLPPGLAPKLRSHHVTDIFAGLQRDVQTYSKTTGSKFMTFRAVSDRSDPRAWIHPGIEARRFFAQAEDYIDRVSKLVR